MRLLFQIAIAIAIGVLAGGLLPTVGENVAFLGELFLRGLLMLVVPLVMTSMVVGVGNLGDARQMGKLGVRTAIYYTVTTGIAVLLGLVLVNVIRPGVADTPAAQLALRGGERLETVTYVVEGDRLTLEGGEFRRAYDDRYAVTLLDREGVTGTVLKSGDNGEQSVAIEGWSDPAGAPVEFSQTERGRGVVVDLAIAGRMRDKSGSAWETTQQVITGLIPRNIFASMADNDVLPLIVISLTFGVILTTLGEPGQSLIRSFNVLNDAILGMVHLIMKFAPVGIGALVAGRLAEAGGFAGFVPELLRIGKFAGTTILGLAIHGAIVLPIILWVYTKRSPLTYALNYVPALLTAFSTSSSSATLPVSLECTVERNHIRAKVADFVLPLGATINMDGTALYEAVSAIFIAQVYGIDLTFVQMVVIFLTATLAAIGAAGIPEAGLVTMAIVLKAVGLPLEGISLLLLVDWFLDRCRTTVNIWGDAIGAAVVESMEANDEGRPSAPAAVDVPMPQQPTS